MGNGEGDELSPSRMLGQKSTEAGPPINISPTVTASMLVCKRAFPPVSLRRVVESAKSLRRRPTLGMTSLLTEDNELSNYHWYSTHYAKTYLTLAQDPKLNN